MLALRRYHRYLNLKALHGISILYCILGFHQNNLSIAMVAFLRTNDEKSLKANDSQSGDKSTVLFSSFLTNPIFQGMSWFPSPQTKKDNPRLFGGQILHIHHTSFLFEAFCQAKKTKQQTQHHPTPGGNFASQKNATRGAPATSRATCQVTFPETSPGKRSADHQAAPNLPNQMGWMCVRHKPLWTCNVPIVSL